MYTLFVPIFLSTKTILFSTVWESGKKVVMDLPETTTHSFIVKIWLEEVADGNKSAVWRGHITHVPDQERRYIQELDEIIDFIVPYLEQMGVRSSRWTKARQWLRKQSLFQHKGKRD